MTLAERDWEQVRDELFGEPYMVWHDGPEFSGLRQAWQREPEALLDLLFAGMAQGDPLAAQSLAELEPAPTGPTRVRVIEKLTAHVGSSSPGAQVQLGLSLYRLTGDARWAEPIAEVLDRAVFWGHRIDAAIALRQVAPSEPLRQVVLRNIQAPDYLVRYHCATTLRRWAGLTGDIDADQKLFPLLIREDDPAAWAEVADALGKL